MKTNFLLHVWILTQSFWDDVLVKEERERQHTLCDSYMCSVSILYLIQACRSPLATAAPFLNSSVSFIALFAWFHKQYPPWEFVGNMLSEFLRLRKRSLPLYSKPSFGLSHFLPRNLWTLSRCCLVSCGTGEMRMWCFLLCLGFFLPMFLPYP